MRRALLFLAEVVAEFVPGGTFIVSLFGAGDGAWRTLKDATAEAQFKAGQAGRARR